MKKINPQKILAAENKILEGAKQMIESPMWFIEQVLLKHEQAVLEVCKELMEERDALQYTVNLLLAELDRVQKLSLSECGVGFVDVRILNAARDA